MKSERIRNQKEMESKVEKEIEAYAKAAEIALKRQEKGLGQIRIEPLAKKIEARWNEEKRA